MHKLYAYKWAQHKYMEIFFNVFVIGHKISSLSLEGTNKVCDGHNINTRGKLNMSDVKREVNNIYYAQKRSSDSWHFHRNRMYVSNMGGK